ncbi:MAG: 50S ribosomal protein L10 [Spirochaetales bacterium]|jgi:large subunit ribosomal protein L10|nr:50S ribosomal protein L10 [Spirochaetales bacterium]
MTGEKKIQQKKLDSVAGLKKEFEGISDLIFTDYRGLTVAQITELRTKLREKKALYRVVKNRFARLALRQLNRPEVADNLVGPTAVAYSPLESGPVAKVLFENLKLMPLKIKGGLVEGRLFNAPELEAYSLLPTRLELISSLMGTMKAPVQKMAAALQAVPSKFVRTLQAVADQKAGL